jgi:5-methylcytosine-specific restriction endonuclease McrA
MKTTLTQLAKTKKFDEFFDIVSSEKLISRNDALLLYTRLLSPTKKQKPVQKPTEQLTYREYLKTDGWKRRRAKAIRRAKGRCEICKTKNRIQVHHLTYARLGKESPNDLQVLCDNCHRNAHESDGKAISESTKAFMAIAAQF